MPSSSQHPICPESEVVPVLAITRVPVHCNLLWPSRSGALSAPRGDIRLGFLPECGHIFNLDFDPDIMEYTQDYENSLHFSPRFQEYATGLAMRLIERYELRHKSVIEIGSGKGDFLKMLCELGDNRGVGFDPSYVPDDKEPTGRIKFIQEFYSERFADYKADFVCCRHVLEHIEHPDQFLSMVRRAVGDQSNSIIFFEVPNVLFTLGELGIWDIIYEHCSYFSPYSLSYVFAQCGFQVLDVRPTFHGQFLTIEASPIDAAGELPVTRSEELHKMAREVTAFADQYQQKLTTWQGKLGEIGERGDKAVVWGAGSKGVMFMNSLPTQDIIEYAVDINPRKTGMYIAGSGQQIVPPDFLRTYQPDHVIVMNANYQAEIKTELQSLGVAADILLA